MPAAVWFKLSGHGWCVRHGVVAFLGFGGWNIADWLRKSSMVEPIDPFEGSEPDGLEIAPWPSSVDDLSLADRSGTVAAGQPRKPGEG